MKTELIRIVFYIDLVLFAVNILKRMIKNRNLRKDKKAIYEVVNNRIERILGLVAITIWILYAQNRLIDTRPSFFILILLLIINNSINFMYKNKLEIYNDGIFISGKYIRVNDIDNIRSQYHSKKSLH
ncbi:MAG: hypothetical protein U9N10_07150 [Bacillota bacterium]|nr:hypothetical protein [Bacillota bacterium]